MKSSDALPTLIQLIGSVFMTDTATLGPESTAADVPGWDSVSQVALIMQIEDDFGVVLDGNEVGEVKNLGELAKLVSERQTGSR